MTIDALIGTLSGDSWNRRKGIAVALLWKPEGKLRGFGFKGAVAYMEPTVHLVSFNYLADADLHIDAT